METTLNADKKPENSFCSRPFDSGRVTLSEMASSELRVGLWAFISEAKPEKHFDYRKAPRLCAEIAELRQSHLEKEPGFFVLTELDTLFHSTEECQAAFRVISNIVGEILPQHSDGSDLREVKDRGISIQQHANARYSDGKHGGEFHTDGAQYGMPVPSYIGLMCIRRAKIGGALQLVSAEKIHDAIKASDPTSAAEMFEPFHFDRRGDLAEGDSPTVTKPIFFRENQKLGVTYLREYIEAGHRHSSVPSLFPAQRKALDAFDTFLYDKEFRTEDCLESGEAIFVNNTSLLHGRSSYEDYDEIDRKRLLLRVWLGSRD